MRTSGPRPTTRRWSTRSSPSATPRASPPRGESPAKEGLLIGGSGGTAIAAALQVATGLCPDAVVVVHIPDSGRGYLSKLYDDGWMADHGFLRAAGPTVGDLLRGRERACRRSCTPIPTRPCGRPSRSCGSSR